MDDLSERDFSGVADESLTPEERRELRRRMDKFVDRMQLRRPGKPGQGAQAEPEPQPDPEPQPEPEPESKRITHWDPATIARRH